MDADEGYITLSFPARSYPLRDIEREQRGNGGAHSLIVPSKCGYCLSPVRGTIPSAGDIWVFVPD
jgi:hypothetical protein